MKPANAILLTLLSVAALASCETTPIRATNPDRTIEMKPASCQETVLAWNQNGSQELALTSSEPMNLSLLAEAHAAAWTNPVDLAISADSGAAPCSAFMNGDTTLSCEGLGPSRQVTVTVTAVGYPNTPPGFTVTLLLSD
jgi:hypothetical protein